MNYEHMQFIYDLAMHTCASMEIGEVTDEADLIGPEPWYFVPPSEQRYVFVRPLAMLVAQNRSRQIATATSLEQQALYRKT